MKSENLLLYSAFDPNLVYETGFDVFDPVLYLRKGGSKYLLLNKLEFDRAKRLNTANVIPLEKIQKLAGTNKSDYSTIAFHFLKYCEVRSASVPPYFPADLFLKLKKMGIKLEIDNTIGSLREVKKESQWKMIKKVEEIAEEAISLSVDILKKSTINGNFLFYEGNKLTCEFLKREIVAFLALKNCVCDSLIVSSGNDTALPHERGSGPIYKDKPIILDIFPQSRKSFYFGDLTRTFVKGKAAEKLKKVFNAVKEAQEIAFSKIREGVLAKDVHLSVTEYFKRAGFKTFKKDGVNQGFIHGTGHGIGLEVHEKPRISDNDYRLKAGNVITVEPGLYYKGIGGVRIEDVVVVTRDGYKNLTTFPKYLEIE